MAAAEGEKRKKKEKKNPKKKARKDKWGQPLPSVDAEDVADPLDDAAAAPPGEKDEGAREQGGGGEDVEHEPKKVVASGMPYSASEEDIRTFFEGVGPVVQLQLSRFPDSGNFRGLAFVTFKTRKDATESLKLDGTKMGNRFIKVERCRLDPERKRKREFLSDPEKAEGCYTAYIGNLSFDVTEDELRGLFDASRIASVRFAINKKTGKFRGFGHIDFEDDDSLEKAISKNQVELHGRPIKIAYAASNRT